MTPLILDTGFLYALLNAKDNHHQAVLSVAKVVNAPIILPTVVTTEVAYLVRKYMGSESLAQFLSLLAEDIYTLSEPTIEDFKRAEEIIRQYNDNNIDFVDVIIVAMAERLKIEQILTIDQRHFRQFRPVHCDAFELFP